MVEAGAALMLEDASLAGTLLPAVQRMFRGDEIAKMSTRSRALGKPDAAAVLARRAAALAGKGRGR